MWRVDVLQTDGTIKREQRGKTFTGLSERAARQAFQRTAGIDGQPQYTEQSQGHERNENSLRHSTLLANIAGDYRYDKLRCGVLNFVDPLPDSAILTALGTEEFV